MGLKCHQQKKRNVLKVRARGDAMVPDAEAMDRGVRAFVGWVFDRELAIPRESDGGWRPRVEPVEVTAEDHAQYLLAIVHGDLWAADEETAKRANRLAVAKQLPPIAFDPTYDGELAELQDYLKDREAEKKVSAPAPAPAVDASTKTSATSKAPAQSASAEGKG